MHTPSSFRRVLGMLLIASVGFGMFLTVVIAWGGGASTPLNSLAAVASLFVPGTPKAGLSVKELTANLLSAKDVGAQVELAKQRGAALKELMRTNPKAALDAALATDVRAKLPMEVQTLLEREATVEGTIDAPHSHGTTEAEPFRNTETKYYYFVRDTSGSVTELHFTGAVDTLVSGSKVRAKGLKIDSDMAVLAANNDSFQVLAAPAVSGGSGARKVAVILVEFSNTTSHPYITPDIARGRVFTDTKSSNAFYKAASYGAMSLVGATRTDGDVYGWVKIPSSNAACNYNQFMTEADAAASKLGYSKSQYDTTVYALSEDNQCPWGGLAAVGGNWAVMASLSYGSTAHEIGHGLGLHHSNSLVCTESTGAVSISNSCTSNEYGDSFDLMGSGSAHFNAFQKGRLGWFGSSATQQVTTAGTYSVTPLETAGGVKALRIPRGTDSLGRMRYFYVSFRQPDMFNWFLADSTITQGVSIHLATDYSVLLQPALIDATPETSTFRDAGFVVGKKLYDSLSGVTITTTAVTPTSATVQVSFGAKACAPAAPGISIAPSPQYGPAGGSATYNVTIANKDTAECAASDVTVTPALPGVGWLQVPVSLQEKLTPGASVTRAVTITSPATAVGTNLIRQTAAKTLAPTLATTYGSAYIVSTATVSTPVVKFTAPTAGATLSGNKPQTITATASDPEGVGSITIALDGATLATCNGLISCSVKWSPGKVGAGTYTLTATAVDTTTARSSGTASITITVK